MNPLLLALVTLAAASNCDYELALGRSHDTGLPIVVAFHTAWCDWCERMEVETWSDVRVQQMVGDRFVLVRVDAEGDGAELAKRLAIRSFPSLVVLEADGTEIGRVAGFRAAPDLIAEVDTLLRERLRLLELLQREATSADDPAVRMDLALALERARRPEAAIERYEALLAMTSPRARVYRDLALMNVAALLARRGDVVGAVARYKDFLSEFPHHDRAEMCLYELGRLQQDLAEHEAAARTFSGYLERYPGGRFATRARRWLEVLQVQP